MQRYITSHIVTAMTPDIVRDLGHLTLGTRLKRLGERLQAQTQELLQDAGLDIPAAHCPVLAALDRLGPLTVGQLTRALGMSQPGVTRLLDRIEAAGHVASRSAAGDRRLRTLTLTSAGRDLLARARRQAWPRIEAAVADAAAGPPGTLLARLAALEDALAAAPLANRPGGHAPHAST
jgi:DNA-binding MarR family transcriptional regulator